MRLFRKPQFIAVMVVGQSGLIAMVRSILSKLVRSPVAVFAALLLFTTAAVAQTKTAAIEVIPQASTVRLEMLGERQKSWSFRDAYAGVVGLGRRIRNFQAYDASGAAVTVRELAPGQFESAPASRFSYEVDLAPPA